MRRLVIFGMFAMIIVAKPVDAFFGETKEEKEKTEEKCAIAEIIRQQAHKAINENIAEKMGMGPVDIGEEFYFIFVLKNRISPVTCKPILGSKPTKVYIDSKHCPISDMGIARKIGLIDYVRGLQKSQLTPDQLKQKIDELIEKRKVLAAIQFGEDSIKILTAIPIKISLGTLIKWIGKKIMHKFLKKMAELNEELSTNLANAVSNYNYILHEVVRNKYGIEDYTRAHTVLEKYLLAKSYVNRYSFLYSMTYGRYVDDKGLLVWLSERTLRTLTHGISEEIVAGIIEGDYKKFCGAEEEWIQEKLSKLYEAAEYTLELAEGCTGEPAIIPVEDGLVTALVMDKSGSMSGEKIKEAQQVAYVYVDTSPEQDFVSLVAFAGNAKSVAQPLSIIEGREILKRNILSLSAGGSTNFGSGLTIALSHLSSTNLTNKRAVLMSDGQHNTGTYKPEVAEFQTEGWPIDTVAFGRNADQETLIWIAAQTGGNFSPASSSNLAQVYHKINVLAHNGSVFRSYNDFIKTGEKLAYNIPVEPDMKKVGFFTNWQGSRMETILFSPSKTVISRSNIDSLGKFVEGETYSCFEINNPQCGTWQALITGYDLPPQGEQVNFHSFCESDVFSNVLGFQPQYSLNEEIRIGVKLAEVINGRLLPLRGARVAVEVKKPSMSLDRFASDFKRKRLQPATLFQIFSEVSNQTRKIPLYDDGLHQDVGSGDGIYANIYNGATINGPYLVAIDCRGITSQGVPVNRTLQESFQVGRIEQNKFTISDFLDVMKQGGKGRQMPQMPIFTPKSIPRRPKKQQTEKVVESLLNQLLKKKR